MIYDERNEKEIDAAPQPPVPKREGLKVLAAVALGLAVPILVSNNDDLNAATKSLARDAWTAVGFDIDAEQDINYITTFDD
mgnify:CR=1 FL=1